MAMTLIMHDVHECVCVCVSKYISEMVSIIPAKQHDDASPEYVEPGPPLPHQQPAAAPEGETRQGLLSLGGGHRSPEGRKELIIKRPAGSIGRS